MFICIVYKMEYFVLILFLFGSILELLTNSSFLPMKGELLWL